MFIVTNESTCHGAISNIGFGNHDPNRSTVLLNFDIHFDLLTQEKSIFYNKKDLQETMTEAMRRAGSSNPKGMAQNVWRHLVAEKKIVKV